MVSLPSLVAGRLQQDVHGALTRWGGNERKMEEMERPASTKPNATAVAHPASSSRLLRRISIKRLQIRKKIVLQWPLPAAAPAHHDKVGEAAALDVKACTAASEIRSLRWCATSLCHIHIQTSHQKTSAKPDQKQTKQSCVHICDTCRTKNGEFSPLPLLVKRASCCRGGSAA